MSWFQRIFHALLLTFLSVLSVSGTIALRNVVHAALLLMLLVYVVTHFSVERARIVGLTRIIPLPLILWCTFLLLFPLFAPDRDGAMVNLLGKGMWGESILTFALAWGSILVLGINRFGLWTLALVSSVPVYIHLVLLVLAWMGVLQPIFYADPTLESVFDSFVIVTHDPNKIMDAFAAFPMGFKGIEPMHGNFGYPASQATCLALATVLAAWSNRDRELLFKAAVLIVACFISVVVAQSRAAAYFALLLIMTSMILYYLIVRKKDLGQKLFKDVHFQLKPVVGVFVLFAGAVFLFVQVASTNLAWYSMWDKVALGLRMEQPKTLLCTGLPDDLIEVVRKMHPSANAEYAQTLVDGLRGDGGRVLMGRVGIDLVVEYPWGLNGGRDAYQHRMTEVCGHEPVMSYSHAHNAWINLALSLGWLGAMLFAWLLISFSKLGWNTLRRQDGVNPTGFALFLLSMFWIIRGMTDAVFQEHYLQMQAFMLLFLTLVVTSTTWKTIHRKPDCAE